ncbi:uncharacterized protein LOC110615117 [Manihot esculenta]|uniref:Uncharacterized protein n=1 Tax=Manihot esculenta TaxID=3983 RepID=A0A2C9VS11_MANES|nr:uncharacterized protein LOC110615117 [Manihot esculenta]OAY48729.1 hypothetical protein MANES_05G001200v8 [Manihot esculenta]
MEQPRLAATATRFYRALYLAHNQARQRGFAAASSGRSADPAVYSEDRDHELKPAVPSGKHEETRNLYEPDSTKRETETEAQYKPTKETQPSAQPRPLHVSSPRHESNGVNRPVEPQIQQKRQNSPVILEEISCAGLDGTPWPMEKGTQVQGNDNDYYRHHKASPLSEIKFADTRKPITRATDGTAYDSGMGRDVIGWRPEQLYTAEETLEMAQRTWRENAMRGDPDSPHGRVLRVLRGEWF